MNLELPIHLATMTPVDWGITAAALLMLVYAARTFVSGKGKSQMGAGFAFVAAFVWTLAIGRHIDGFTYWEGFRVAIGVLFLVPVFRVFFTHTGGSIVFAVISLILASLIAGPVVTKYGGQLTSPDTPRVETVQAKIDEVDAAIETKTKTRDAVAGFMAEESAKLAASGLKTAEEVEANPEAFAALQKYARYKDQLNGLFAEIADLESRRAELQKSLDVLKSGDDSSKVSQTEAERIRRQVEADVEREKPLIEKYSERGEMLELFEAEFGDPGSETSAPETPGEK